MIKIIDATLTMLEEYPLKKELVYEFARTLESLCIWGAVLTPRVYQLMQGDLPQGIIWYMELPSPSESVKYPGIHFFFSSF